MIASIISFSLKSMLCSGVFMAYYMLALKNAQMNGFNRVYLLTAALLSLLLPFAEFELYKVVPVEIPAFPLLHISGKATEELLVNPAATYQYNWQLILTIAYFTVTAAMVLRLVVKSIKIYSLKSKGLQVKTDGFLLVETDDPRAPFSFINMLFWPRHMRQDSPEGKGILMHELAHIKQHHTIDKIFMQIILAASWLNPFNWLIRNELWLQHEFIADRYAIKDRDTETFAKMLLYGVTGSGKLSIVSPFFQSPVKRRLLMLAQPGKCTYRFLRGLLAVPLVLITAFLMAANTKKPVHISRSPNKIVIVLDAAHGGEDAGGKSVFGYQEKDLTLAICKKMAALSKEYNIEVITTRDEDVFPTLKQRLSTSNSSTDAALFLSVHVNKSSATDPRGNDYEIGINPKGSNYDMSILLASSIANKLKIQKLPVKVVDHGAAYLIKENKHPALLIECGNLDDADNIALLSDNDRTETLCRNILSGIVEYNTSIGTK